MTNDGGQFTFRGFRKPTYTQVPDELFDELMPMLSGAELKVLLYIVRRTFGWKKDSDTISLNQMLNGVHRANGQMLDHGVGLTKKTLLVALTSLQDKRIILTERRQSPERGWEPTSYRLNVLTVPLGGEITSTLGEKVPQGVGGETTPRARGKNYSTQQTVLQDTVEQQTAARSLRHSSSEISSSKIRKGTPESSLTGPVTSQPPQDNQDPPRNSVQDGLGGPSGGDTTPGDTKRRQWDETGPKSNPTRSGGHSGRVTEPRGFASTASVLAKRAQTASPRNAVSEERQVITDYLRDFALELHDGAPLKSTVTRACRLFEQSGVSLEAFVSALYEARSITRERMHAVRSGGGYTKEGKWVPKKLMAYYLAVLEDVLGLREHPEARRVAGTTNRPNSDDSGPQGTNAPKRRQTPRKSPPDAPAGRSGEGLRERADSLAGDEEADDVGETDQWANWREAGELVYEPVNEDSLSSFTEKTPATSDTNRSGVSDGIRLSTTFDRTRTCCDCSRGARGNGPIC
jgi:hypothetical protein